MEQIKNRTYPALIPTINSLLRLLPLCVCGKDRDVLFTLNIRVDTAGEAPAISARGNVEERCGDEVLPVCAAPTLPPTEIGTGVGEEFLAPLPDSGNARQTVCHLPTRLTQVS